MQNIKEIEYFIKAEGFIPMCEDKIKEFADEIRECKISINSNYAKRRDAEDKDKWQYEFLIESHEDAMKWYEKEMKRFRFLISKAKGKVSKSQFDVELIKQVPIGSLLQTNSKRSDAKRQVYNCPIHEERTPSFVWYKESNSWYCFGCAEGGTVIDLQMKIYSQDFKQACESLKHYI